VRGNEGEALTSRFGTSLRCCFRVCEKAGTKMGSSFRWNDGEVVDR